MLMKAQHIPLILAACFSLILMSCGDDESPENVDNYGGMGGFVTDTNSCTPNCMGKDCGYDGCGGSCGQCITPQVCSVTGQCTGGCQPNCAGKQCGANGCGGTCGQCAAGQQCNAQFMCINTCTPNCTGKQCGANGCGGSCGTCPSGLTCNAQQICVTPCTPNCVGKQCGNDGCGGTCGSCAPGTSCNTEGLCVKPCAKDCVNKQCGNDGCGGSCGTCPQSKFCKNNQCVDECQGSCAGKECGDDGCGGSCGTCVNGKKCQNNKCEDSSGTTDMCTKPDASETNESMPGKNLGDIEDCDKLQPAVKATIHNGDDVDWYQYSIDDKTGCDVEPTVKFTGGSTGAKLEVCAFYTCGNDKKANIKCKGENLSENTELGEKTHGCCTTLSGTQSLSIAIKPKCSTLGLGNESGKVNIRVKPKETTKCASYSFEWGDS